MDLLQKINAVWQRVSLIQRALLAAVVLTFIIVAVLVVRWARQPDMRLLYQGLSVDEASKIAEKIAEKDIPYQLRDGGTTIYVPSEQVYQLRLDMAKEGLPAARQPGYRLFDEEKIGTSPFVQNVNLKRALEQELAKSIQMIEGVSHARVHIVTSDQTLFNSESSLPTASVVLQLEPGYRPGGSTIAAVTHLVAGSVERLKPENITVVDSQGRLLSGGSDETLLPGVGTVQDYRERVEQTLAGKVEDMLTTVLGPGRATVEVSAVIDMNSVSIVREIYDPTKRVPTKEEITSGSETKPAPASGNQAAPAVGTKKDETIVTEYAVGKVVEQRVDVPGEIKSLTVAAFVDLSPPDANASQAGAQAQPIMSVADVEEVITKALGLKDTDSLKVVNARFYRPPAPLIDQQQSSWQRYIAIARQASLGVMAICAFLVLKIFGGARKKAAAASASQLPAGQVGGLLPGAGEQSKSLNLRKQLAEALRADPEKVRELFYSWLTEKQQ